MADAVKIEIVSPEALVLSEEAETVTVPGEEGYLTVMGEHAPLMTTLKPGFVTVQSGEKALYFVRGGFADIAEGGSVTVLTEEARPAGELERSEIEGWIADAEQHLAQQTELEDQEAARATVDSWKNFLVEAENLANI